MPRSTHTLTLPASTQSLEAVRRFVATHAIGAHLAETDVEQVKLAVDEACTNVVKHAYRGRTDETFKVSVIVEPASFIVRICDTGVAFRPGEYHRPDLIEAVQSRRRGGLGVHLMRRLMDRVEYRSKGKVNEVRLVKYRDGKA